MNLVTDKTIKVRLSLVCCEPTGASVLTRLAPNTRTRTLPVFQVKTKDFTDLEASIRNKLGPLISDSLTTLEQIETGFESGQLTCDVLGLITQRSSFRLPASDWWPMFNLFPWEDWRKGMPKTVRKILLPQLLMWAERLPDDGELNRSSIRSLFEGANGNWRCEHLVQRYDLLYRAGLLPEALRDQSGASVSVRHHHIAVFGQTMFRRDRRQLGMAISKLRQDLQYRPMLYSLVAGPFSLGQLQKSTEHLTGLGLHTQNFRRDILRSGLIKAAPTSLKSSTNKAAKLYQWMPDINIATNATGIPMPRKKHPNSAPTAEIFET